MIKDLKSQVDQIAEQSRHDHRKRTIIRVSGFIVTTYLVLYTLIRTWVLTGHGQTLIGFLH